MTEPLGVPGRWAARRGTEADRPASDADHLDPRSILTSIGEVIYDWDIPSDRLSLGLNACEVLGFPSGHRPETGRTWAAVVEPGSGRSRYDVVFSEARDGTVRGGTYRTSYGLRTTPGRLLTVEDSGRWLPGSDGRPAAAHGVVRVVRPDARRAVGLEDGLAGASRSAMAAHFDAELSEAARIRRPATVMVAAIDGLGRINENAGFAAADEVIAGLMARLGSAMRSRDRLFRHGGNRFAALLASCPADQAAAAAARFLAAVERAPIMTAAGPVLASLTIGTAVAPADGSDSSQLLRRAELALAEARRTKLAHLAYSSRVEEAVQRRRVSDGGLDIVSALNDRRIRIARQPIVEARSRQRAFDEVLMRIARPDGTIVPAGEVIPAAERLGLVRLVDHRVLELAIACLGREPGSRLAVNVSAMTLRDPDWLPTLTASLGARPGTAGRLIVEVTETAAIDDPAATAACLTAVKALGVSVAIDDFGAGHTSFRHLRDFPVDIIKIDGAFVQNLSRSTDDRFFVRTLVELARRVGVAVVAEWVEDEAAAALLAEWGVDYLQGDAIGGPAVVDEEPAPQARSAGS